MEEACESISVFCRAQTRLNALKKTQAEKHEAIHERIKTCKTLLIDELVKSNVTCVEITPDNETVPTYLRLKPKTKTKVYDKAQVINILQEKRETVLARAMQSEYDLPKTIVAIFQEEIRQRDPEDAKEMTLSITQNKERGYLKNVNLSEENLTLAKNLLSARQELNTLKHSVSHERKQCCDMQKQVKEDVIKQLKHHDPTKQTQKVHLSQSDGDWVYYLRHREKTVTPNMGVRRVIPIIELAACKALEQLGLSREFVPTSPLPTEFWSHCMRNIETTFDDIASQKTVTSHLTLDRAAPRD